MFVPRLQATQVENDCGILVFILLHRGSGEVEDRLVTVEWEGQLKWFISGNILIITLSSASCPSCGVATKAVFNIPALV